VSGIKININLLLTPFFKQNRFLVFLFHWFAWLVLHFITFLPTLVNMSKISAEVFLYNHLALVTLNFLLFYVVAFVIMPRVFALQNKWFWVLIASLLLVIFFTYFKFRLEMAWFDYLWHKNPVPDKFSRKPLPESLGIFSYRFRSYSQLHILNNLSIVVVAFAYRLLLGWFQQEKVRKELENQKLQTELSYLKMQVNPHFLFNALNNIYSLAIIENSKMTGDSILKLSDLLRYMLYEKEDTQSKVSLDREIDHINSYIDLEKLRHLGQMYVNFSIEGDVNGKRIVPLLLFPLIENAFKHGVLTDRDKPVTIDLKITDHHLLFVISNFINTYQKDVVGGIGLQNVRKRLDLIYGESYKLDIAQHADRFNVNLQLPL
jgi:two-component system, LytTR family, sensor kinase